ncbi:MAG: DNA polymerase II [Granulosicoccus sp.]
MSIKAFLLTRGWRDTPAGVELSLWGATPDGAVHVIVSEQEAICFIAQNQPATLPARARRQKLTLTLLDDTPVDGLYFHSQRNLQTFRQSGVALAESDIKPVDRFLMERFIRAGFQADGDIELIDGVRTMHNPRLTTAEVAPALTAVALDIETRGSSQQLYSIAGACMQPSHGPASTTKPENPAVVFMIGEGQPERRNGYTLYYCDDEKSVLIRFFSWLDTVDPDILCGWSVVNFDLNFIDQKCRTLGIPFRIGRGSEAAAVLQPGNPGSPRIARVPGRAVLDGIGLLKAGFWAFESFSLDNVAHELLGEGKLIAPAQDKVSEINRLFQDDKPQLADYNLKDCTLVNDIFIKADLVAFAVQRANLTGLAMDRLGGAVAAFDNLYLPLLHRRGCVAPDTQAHENAQSSPGGYVMDSAPGLYENVLVFDFKSLYPSIIRTFFIDPLGLAKPGDNPVPGFLDASFSRNAPILPSLIETLWSARDEAKRTDNAPLSQAIKIIMNSLYGVLGSTGCRFFNPQLASSITRRGHEIITESRDWIELAGYQVIYGDTDSLFVWLGDHGDLNTAEEIGRTLTQGLNEWWSKALHDKYQIQSHLEVEFETHYSRFLMPTVRGMPTGSKKRYAGLVKVPDGEPQLVVKGLEAARTDWTPLARNFQRELFRRVFLDLPYEQFVRHMAEQLLAGELDSSLVYRKRLRRKLSDYQKNVPPHVQAARKLDSASGSWIQYAITRNGPEPVQQLESPLDYQHYLDKQLAPAADGILQFLDTSFAAITDAQMSIF